MRMVDRIPDVVSYAPMAILIDDRSDGMQLFYDRMTGFLAPWEQRSVDGRTQFGLRNQALARFD